MDCTCTNLPSCYGGIDYYRKLVRQDRSIISLVNWDSTKG